MRVLIAGGSGYIGRRLAGTLLADGHQVAILTRSASTPAPAGARSLTWDATGPVGAWVSELSNMEAVVNLAGASIGGGRWTRKRMTEILGSRLSATAALVDGIRRTATHRRPRVLVNASGIDYYGDRGDERVTETSTAGGSFLASVCQQWEAAAQVASSLGTRVVLIRTAFAVGREAPAFRLLTLPFRLFAGGPLGDGRQWFTWIHVDDLVGLYRLALDREDLSGPVNAVAPDVRRQRDLAKEIGRLLHRPSVFPAPAPLLRLALGRQAELLLDGRRAIPAVAQAKGFSFGFGSLPEALAEALH